MDDKVTQAKFLVGVMDLQKDLRGIIKAGAATISGGSKPDDPAPEDWLEKYNQAVREATHKICDPEFTHDMAMDSLGKRITELIGPKLDELLSRLKA